MPKRKLFDLFSRAVFTNQHFHLMMIMFLAFLMLFINLNKGGLSGYDDAFYAHEGKQMLATGDWWNVKINGYLNFEYPPLFIWLEAISFSILGLSDFAAKFPTALLGFLTIPVVFYLAKELSDNFWMPVVSAWVLMLSQYFMKYAMHAMTDVPFVFFFTLAIFCYVKGSKQSKYLAFYGVAVGLAIMTRSVLGFIPLAVIFSHIILTRQFQLFRSKELWIGLLIALLIPAVWYVPQYQAYGQNFLTGHFSFIGEKVAASEKPFSISDFLRGLVEYPWLLLRLYQPWLLLMLIGLVMHIKRGVRQKNSVSILLILWVAFVIIPFSVAEAKVLRYILPAFPAFAILVATPVGNWLGRIKREKIILAGYSLLCLLILGIVLFPTPRLRAEEIIQVAEAVDANTPPDQRVVLYVNGDQKCYCNYQLLWYSNRFTEYLTKDDELRAKLYSGENLTFMTDKNTFQRYSADSQLKLQILDESDNFIYFKNNSSD